MKSTNKHLKRPMLLILGSYLVYLFLVLIAEPSWGDRIYGWSRREAILSEQLEGRTHFTGTILSWKRSTYGYQAIILIEEPVMRCLVYFSDTEELHPGDRIHVEGRITAPAAATNPGQWDQQLYFRQHRLDFILRPTSYSPESSGGARQVFSFVMRSRDAVENQIRLLYPQPYSGILSAMLLGDTALLEEEERDLFGQAGISHIIAISGLHLSILISLVEKRSQGKMLSRKRRYLTMASAWGYALWTGGSVATLRAALMLSVREGGSLLGRDTDTVSTVCFAALVQLLWQPLNLYSSSFWLSYGALVGMSLGKAFVLRVMGLCGKPRLPYRLSVTLASLLGVSVFTLPLTAWFFYQVSLFSFLLNLWVIPMMAPVLLCAIVSLLLSGIHLDFGYGLSRIVILMLRTFEIGSKGSIRIESLLERGIRIFNLSPNLRFFGNGRPEIVQMVLYYGLLFLVFQLSGLLQRRRNDLAPGPAKGQWSLKESLLMASSCIVFLYLLLPVNTWRVTFLDVGQGDCAVIEWNGRVLLEDAGPSYSKVIEPYLQMRGIHQIDLILLSHPDADHREGVDRLVSSTDFTVGAILTAEQASFQAEAMEQLQTMATERDIPIYYLRSGDEWNMTSVVPWEKQSGTGLNITILSPDREYASVNAGSLVSLVEIEGMYFLFTGDMDEAAEANLIKTLEKGESGLKEKGVASSPEDLILKVAHHGSDSASSAEFLEFFAPVTGVISCGRNNAYGHPHPAVMERLEELAVPALVTARQGAVWVQGLGQRYRIYTWGASGNRE